jgi:replicative DNA helicase
VSSPFPFDVQFQRSIARLAMLDEAFASRAFKHVEPSFFTTRPLGWMWTTMTAYWQKYMVRMTEVPMRDSLRYVEPENVTSYASEIEAVTSIPYVAEHAYVREALTDFCRRSIFAQAHKTAQDLYNQGKPVEAYDETQRALDRIREITFEDENRSFFFEQFEERHKKRIIDNATGFQRVFTTGLGLLDEACDGGSVEGEVWLVQGYAKAGKSTWLINCGFRCLRAHREPVLHIQLEGKREQTEARYDARFAGEFYKLVRKGTITPVGYRDMMEEYQRLRGLLVIRAMTDWDVTALDIEAELKTLAARGFKPKMLITDYVDLMRSRNKNVDSETQHQLDATRDLKRLTMNWSLMTHTVSQTQRPKEDADEYEHVIRAAKIADAYAKIRVVDFVGSLNSTRKEREQNICRFYAEMHRDNPMGLYLRLTNDIERMKIGVRAEQIEFKEDAPRRRKKEDAGGSSAGSP